MHVLLQRGLERAFSEFVDVVPVTILEGGRAVGKSTLCRVVGDQRGWPAPLDLAEPQRRAQLLLDPIRFLSDLPTPAMIDEAQLEPELPLWVKHVVDRRQRSGQFVLTGSARLGREQLGGSDPLAGRAVRLRLWGLTESELAGTPAATARALFDAPADAWLVQPAAASRRRHDWSRGGLPGLAGVLTDVDESLLERAMSGYVESVVPLGAGSSRVDHARLLWLFRHVAANPGQILNLARLASELGMTAPTAAGYLEMLEASFLLYRVEAHRPSEHKVLTAHPRIFATDVALAAWANRYQLDDARVLGSLMENRIAAAVAATIDWSTDRITLRHWRDQRNKRETDLLAVHADGRTVPIEVKASSVVGPGDTRGLVAFAAANPSTFRRAFLVYRGDRTVDLSPPELPARSILAVPDDVFLAASA